MGYLISPLIGGVILANSSFKVLYIVAALTLLPFLYYMHKYLSHIKEPSYSHVDVLPALKNVLSNNNLKSIFIVQLTVESFYSVMVIYSPLYLATIGIPLTTYLTYILPIALVPLVLLPYEIGFLADRKHNEKDVLIIGLLTMVITTFLCVIVQSPDPRIWTVLFLISRIGTSLAETMAYTYFFKKVGPEDASLTALFMNIRGVSIIIVGSIGFIFAPFLVDRPQLMFVILGLIILWGISHALKITTPPNHQQTI
jgi:hypothetical protein